MTPKVFFSLGAAALVSFMAAGVVNNMSSPMYVGAGLNELVLPQLKERLRDAETLTVTQSGKSLTFKRADGSWLIQTYDGFPASNAKIRRNIIGLSELIRVEPKTTKSEFYPEIELEDPQIEGAKSREVTVLASNGDVLADLIVGKTRSARGAAKSGVYVRTPGEQQSWLASGDVLLTSNLEDWLDNRLVGVSLSTVERLSVIRGNTFPVDLIKLSGDNRGYEQEMLPDGMSAKSEFALQNEVRKAILVTFDTVRRAVGNPAEAVQITLNLTSGLTMNIDLFPADDGGKWARVSAEVKNETSTVQANQINRTYAGFEVHLDVKNADDLTVKLADVVDIDAS
jgi:hypothetical protein